MLRKSFGTALKLYFRPVVRRRRARASSKQGLACIGICVGATRSKHLEKTLASSAPLARSRAHTCAIGLLWHNEDTGNAASAGGCERDADCRECASGSHATFYCQRDRHNESERELVGEWGRGRQRDKRNDQRVGGLHCSG
jgi:hypothetical protein